MSAHNLKMRRSLGESSPAQFSAICGYDSHPLEAGFNLCSIGQLFRQCVAEGQVVDDSKVACLCEDLGTLDWSTALDQDEMYRTAFQKHDDGWNRAVWHTPKMKYALATALNGQELVEEECIEEEGGLDVDEAGNFVSRFFFVADVFGRGGRSDREASGRAQMLKRREKL